jgi:hypothetical protein
MASEESSSMSVSKPLALSPSFFKPIFSKPRSSSTSPPRTSLRLCFGSSEDGMVALNPRISEGGSSCPRGVSREREARPGIASMIARDEDVVRFGREDKEAGSVVGRRRRGCRGAGWPAAATRPGMRGGGVPDFELEPALAWLRKRGCIRDGATGFERQLGFHISKTLTV